MTDLGPVLARLGLSQYTEAFINEGFDSWETVLDITESDLDVLNVKLGHRRRLQREIANVRGIAIEHLVPSSTLAVSIDGSHPEDVDEDQSGIRQSSEKAPTHTGKRRYRRHPRPDENAPERPPSAYVIFSNKTREDLKSENLSFTEIAKRVGEGWQLLRPEQKEPYESQAGRLKEKYSAELVKYKRTSEYREYAEYLVDFKAKNAAAITTNHKRPRLGAQNSTENNTSAESRTGSGRAVASFGRSRMDSTGSGQTSPTDGTVPENVSLSSTSSPTTYSTPLELSRSQGAGVPRFPSLDRTSSIGSDSPAITQPLNISTLESRIPPLVPGGLPPPRTSGTVSQPSGSSQMNLRRLHQAPPSFLRNDTVSSISSRSSNLSSSANASSPSSFTPITPIEENTYQRSLLLPTILTGGGGGHLSLGGDHDHQSALLPPLTQPPQMYKAVSTLPYDSSPSSMAGGYPKKDQVLSGYGASYTHSSPWYSRNNITNGSAALSDVPGERHSLRDLSLAGSPTASRNNLRSHTYELRGAEYQPSEHIPQRPYDIFHPQAHHYERRPSTLGPDGNPILIRDDRLAASSDPSRLDGLSVLALAGRLVDREARKPP